MANTQPAARRGVRAFPIVIVVAVLALAGGAGWWVVEHAGVVVTSDARVRARMVTVSSGVAGRILKVELEAGDRVGVGEAIARLDDREARLAFGAATLEL